MLVFSCTMQSNRSLLREEKSTSSNDGAESLVPFAQSGAITNDEMLRLSQDESKGNLAYDRYRKLLSEMSWNQPNAESFSQLGIKRAPADFVREMANDGNLLILDIPNGGRYLDSPRFQSLIRNVNLFLLSSKLTSENGAKRLMERTNVRDVPANLRAEFKGGNVGVDFGAIGLSVSGKQDLKITLNLANVSELRARQAVSWVGAHVLSGDFYGARELAAPESPIIPQFRTEAEVSNHLKKQFGQAANLADGLRPEEINEFILRVKVSRSSESVSLVEMFSAMPFLWNWNETYLGSWPKAVHRKIAIDTIRSIANAPTVNASLIAHHLRNYRDSTRLLQQWENAIEPRSGLERFDLSLVPVKPGDIDVNAEEGNFEITAKMPVSPILRKSLNPETNKWEYVETLIDLAFEEKKALLGEYARILAELHGNDSTVRDISKEPGSHGHSLVIKYLVSVKTEQGDHEYVVELDGQSREYNVEEGEFRVAMNTVRGGSLEAVGGKQRMTQAYLLLRFFAAEQMGLFPLRQSGGGHLTTGLQSYVESARRSGSARSLARMFWMVHRFQGIFAFMVMNPQRVKGAIPFHFSPKQDEDRVPTEFEVGRRPFKNIDELLTFDGAIDEFMKRLVDSRYFCDRHDRKMKYLFMNMLQALGNYLDAENIGPDYDVKKGEWAALAPLKGNRFTRENRGLDAPRDAFEAMLQLRLWRSIDAWALSDKAIPTGVISQETYLEYAKFARNPDIAAAEFRRFMGMLGMEGGFDRLYEVWLWRRISEVQVELNSGTFVDAPERLKSMPRQFRPFGPGISKPRTSAETERLLREYIRKPFDDVAVERRERRLVELENQQARRESELKNPLNEVRPARDFTTPITVPVADGRDSVPSGKDDRREQRGSATGGASACDQLRMLYE